MGSKKKERAKARKQGKQEFAALREAVAKANACTPAAATALLAPAAGPGKEEVEDAASSSLLSMALPATSAGGPALRLRFEYHSPASLPKAWRDPLFQIFKGNMQGEYERNWGYREAEKRAEIFAPEARYLVALPVVEENDDVDAEAKEAEKAAPAPQSPPAAAEQEQQQQQPPPPKTPLGFVHLRFVLDEEDESPADAAVLYVYEIQLAPALQRRGVGQRLMALSERLARGLGLRKMKLTVFKTNAAALAFYQAKLGYGVDASSPSKWGVAECYEILSKPLNAATASTA